MAKGPDDLVVEIVQPSSDVADGLRDFFASAMSAAADGGAAA